MERIGPVSVLINEFKEKEEKLKELNDKYLRAAADLDNFRKLMQKEMQNYRLTVKAEFFHRVIPVLDSFSRAIGNEVSIDNFEKFVEGVDMICRQLKEALQSLGMEEFSGIGEVFDPARHEAVAMVDAEDQPDNMIIEEISRGYKVGDRIIKPAKVIVVKPKEEGGSKDVENNRD